MDPYQVLKALQDTGQFDKLRAEIFSRPSVQKQFEVIQKQLIHELSSSPLLVDVPLKMRHARLPQIFNSFRLAVRKTSVANDIHSILWNVLNEMVSELYSAVENAISQPHPVVQSSMSFNNVADQDKPDGKAILKPDIVVDSQVHQPVAASAEVTSSPALLTNEAAENSVTINSGQKNDSKAKKNIKGTKPKKRSRLYRMDSKSTDKNESNSISDDDYVPAKKRGCASTFLSPQEPISKRVEIWWPLDKTWYKGVVTAFRARDKKHHIRYDDNEIEWLDLCSEKWRYDR